MLPSFLRPSYKQYKTDSDFVATWLARSAQHCGYPKDLLVGQVEQIQKAPKLKGRARKLARDAAKQSPSAATDTAAQPSKYVIATKDFIALAEWITKTTKPIIKVPVSFVNVLDRAIAVRKKHHSWWTRNEDNPYIDARQNEEANKKHEFFIDILEQVREILRPRMPAELLSDIPAVISGEVNKGTGSLPNLFAGLHVEHPSDPLPASTNPQPDPVSSTLLQDEYTIVQEQDIEEVYFAVHCLFNDLDNIRSYLSKVWKGYKAGAFDLIAASITTNTAIEFSRRLQEDFIQTFPQHGDFERHINVLYVQQCLAYDEDPASKERFDDEMNFNIYSKVEPLMFPTYMLLSSFCDVVQPGSLPMYKPGFFGKYDASSDRASKSARNKFREDKVVLLEILPEFCVLANYRGGDVPAEDELTRGIRELVKTKEVQIWLVFATQLFLDIHHILRDQVAVGFRDLAKSAQYVAAGINSTLEFHQNLRIENWPRSNDQVLAQILQLVSDWVQTDKISEIRATLIRRSTVQPPAAEPFRLLKQHPLYCGLLSYSIRNLALEAAVTFANAWGSVLYCAHLYNAVRQEKLLTDVWADMNLALFMHKTETMFAGDFPKTCEDYFKRFCLAMGYSASNFAKDRRSGRPVASKAGPRGLNDLAPVSNKFKARFCYGEERSGLLPADVEAILQEYDENAGDFDLEGESGEWFRPEIKIIESNSAGITDTKQEARSLKSEAKRGKAQVSVASGVKPVRVLNALLQAIQSEALELTFDHFRLHTFCWRLLRSVQQNLDSELREIYGAGYLEKENQLPYVVGYTLMTASQTSKLAGVLLPKKTDLVTSRLLAKAAESIKTMIQTGAGGIEIGMLKKQFGFEVEMDDALGIDMEASSTSR